MCETQGKDVERRDKQLPWPQLYAQQWRAGDSVQAHFGWVCGLFVGRWGTTSRPARKVPLHCRGGAVCVYECVSAVSQCSCNNNNHNTHAGIDTSAHILVAVIDVSRVPSHACTVTMCRTCEQTYQVADLHQLPGGSHSVAAAADVLLLVASEAASCRHHMWCWVLSCSAVGEPLHQPDFLPLTSQYVHFVRVATSCSGSVDTLATTCVTLDLLCK